MKDFYEFASGNGFFVILVLAICAYGAWYRLMEHLNIRKAGWPPRSENPKKEEENGEERE